MHDRRDRVERVLEGLVEHMRGIGELNFEVYFQTRTSVVTLVREVSFRTAHVIARHHADTRGQSVFIRNCATKAIETVGPNPQRG